MLQSIREHTQGWIAGVIISIIIFTFALWGIHSYFVGGGESNVIAEVNGVQVTREQLSAAYERLRRQTQYGANPLAVKDDAEIRNRALQALIDLEVLKQASIKEGFGISDRQVDGYLQSMPEFQVNGQFSLDRFQEILSSSMLSTSEFLDLMRTGLLIEQPKLGIVFSSFALPDEVNHTISLVNQERDIDYITIPVQYFMLQPITISPEKIQAYYQQHQAEFMTPEQVSLEYVELNQKDISTQINPTENALKNYYNENINSYTQPMAWKLASVEITVPSNASADATTESQKKAASISEALAKGSDVAVVGKGYTVTQAKEWSTLAQLPADWQKSVSALTKPGQVSEPILTDKGFVVVKVIEVKESQIQPYESVKDKVKQSYIRQHAEEKFAEARDQLANLTYEHPDSLQSASKGLNLPIKTSEVFTREKGGTDITQNKKVRDTAFNNDVLSLQNNSDVIQINPETVVVIRLKTHTPSTLLPLANVSKQIEEKLKAQEAEAKTAKFAEEIKSKLISGQDPITAASSNRLNWSKAGYIGRYSTKVDPAVLDVAFRLPHPVNNKSVYGMAKLPKGFAIVAVKSVKDGKIADPKQYTVFAEQVQNSEGMLEYELYRQSQVNNSTIKVID